MCTTPSQSSKASLLAKIETFEDVRTWIRNNDPKDYRLHALRRLESLLDQVRYALAHACFGRVDGYGVSRRHKERSFLALILISPWGLTSDFVSIS